MKNPPLYDQTIPVFARSLKNVVYLLKTAEKSAKQRKFDINNLLHARLAPDMFDLTQQVQYIYFVALDAATNLSGIPMPKGFSYDEKNLYELEQSIQRTISFLNKIRPTEFIDADTKKVPLFWDKKKMIPAERYVRELAVPDFFFHVVTLYAILRHNGVAIGKDDYLGTIV